MEVWKYANMQRAFTILTFILVVWWCGSVEVWKFGSLEICKYAHEPLLSSHLS